MKEVLTADGSIAARCHWTAVTQGLITPVLTNRRPSQLNLCDSPFAQLTCFYRDNDNGSTESISGHCGEIDRCKSISTSEAIGTAAAAATAGEMEEEASGVLCLVCDLSIFRQEPGMGSICYRQLIFHWWPSRDERAKGEKKKKGERWDDDMALQGS